MNDHTRIWCLRHAESENVTAAVAGTVPAAPLTERGHTQAAAAARALADEPISAIYTSTALRTQQTAAPLAAARGIHVHTLPDLAEVGIGGAEGSTDPAIGRQTAEVLRAWILNEDLAQHVADGETGHDVIARITAAFGRIADRHPGQTVAVVGHTASLTAGLGRLCNLGGRVWGTPLPHAEPFLIDLDGHTWHCPAWPGTNQ
ncbi:histidine phosphatase family protein [Catenulispora sp. NL8]|uniref:Histidine phosphatase family protein n=1 Tax=Catenulispora pinistramenti TaxID=2705254 RepID=A0ABS5KUB1_9ACTN|nr:histidine phosphatase family protein [Catenulispora pinistramenti]MBS2549626.1 histidine phosphatase family protein [Catenulispora pinistramenti]